MPRYLDGMCTRRQAEIIQGHVTKKKKKTLCRLVLERQICSKQHSEKFKQALASQPMCADEKSEI